MRGAVVVASLLSQLSQQCGAALVRVRDKVSRSTPSDASEGVAQSFLRVARRRRAHRALGQATEQSAPDVRGKNQSRPRTESRPTIEAPPRRRERNKYRS